MCCDGGFLVGGLVGMLGGEMLGRVGGDYETFCDATRGMHLSSLSILLAPRKAKERLELALGKNAAWNAAALPSSYSTRMPRARYQTIWTSRPGSSSLGNRNWILLTWTNAIRKE